MLIVCSGQDTFRALQKTRELEMAFKQKHDPQGLCVERLTSGKEAIAEIAARARGMSLFASRRFVRTADVLREASKAQRFVLKNALCGDQDGFILLTQEEEKPSRAILEEFGSTVKVISYDFPLLNESAFIAWAIEQAKVMGFQNILSIREVAQAHAGDGWSCYFELMKRAANEGATILSRPNGDQKDVFGFADAYACGDAAWFGITTDADLTKQALTLFLNQARTAVRVRDRVLDGVHPYVARKLQGKNLEHAHEALARVLEGFFVQRTGYADEKEALAIL